MRFLTNVDISNFYSNFLSIDRQDVEFIIHEYQNNKELIKIMALEQRLQLEYIYLEALFNVGSYGIFLRVVDETIEEIIDKNIVYIERQNVFESLLFKKASALFHSGFIDESLYVILELIKINPNVTLYKAMLGKIYYKRNENRFQHIKWICVILVIVAALVYGVNLLIVRPVTGEYLPILFDLGFLLLNIGFLSYILGEIFSFAAATLSSRYVVNKIKKNKVKPIE
ncbi:hypothetical protein [Membranihabitans marinus]|uniref:hypothetical protein n=1 Tax=Membranihabitans marinus TaxID=1227546 RepID=UPI001F2103E6|nr:hypothetical protein [Membranihabitans marinus]